MRFESLFAGAALVAAAMAQSLAINSFPNAGVVAGQTYEVTYSPADNTPTTFILRQGPSGNLNTVGTLTTSATGGKFSWTVAADLPNHADYALEIRRGDEVNYSAQFGLTGGSAAAPPASSPGSMPGATVGPYPVSTVGPYPISTVHPVSTATLNSTVLSTIISTISAILPNATASAVPGGNGTNATASAIGTIRPTTTATGGLAESTGGAASMAGSSFAAVFGAVAAFAYLA